MKQRSPLVFYAVSYALAVLAPLASAAAGVALQTSYGYRLPLISFYPAVMLTAWYGGFWPGIAATAVSLAVVDRVWLGPLREAQLTNPSDPVTVLLFLGIGVAISGFSESLHRSRNSEHQARERAEERAQALRESEGRLQLSLTREHTARTEAENANRLKDQFLAIVSHELRTPLNALLGWADMLKSGVLPENRRARAIEAVHANALRQAQLVNDLLDVALMMEGKLQLRRSPVKAGEVLQGALEIVRREADLKHIEVKWDGQAPQRPLDADGGRLQQVFWNLLTNAIKFTPEHGVVKIGVRETNEAVEISVADTGRGIPTELLRSIFEPFRQADASTTRLHGGLGLGLSIVKHLVEAHGGTVSGHSAGDGLGATFIVRLPLPSAVDDTVPLSQTPSLAYVTSLAGVCALVVDDDADSREVLTAHLQEKGVRVLTARSAREGFEIAERELPNVMLVDVAMPGEDGYSFISRIRNASSLSLASIPAAAVTAFARDEDRERALNAGFQRHITKPVTSATLLGAVASLVDGDGARAKMTA